MAFISNSTLCLHAPRNNHIDISLKEIKSIASSPDSRYNVGRRDACAECAGEVREGAAASTYTRPRE